MYGLFMGCSSLISLPDISKWNMYNVEYLKYMFYQCSKLKDIPDIYKWNLNYVKDKNEIKDIFYGCPELQSKYKSFKYYRAKKLLEEKYYYIKNHIYNIAWYENAELIENDIFRWKITFSGFSKTPYENGKFVVSVKFDEDFPNKKPEAKFLTKIYHLNVDWDNGHFDFNWDANWGLNELINTIAGLLSAQNPRLSSNYKMVNEYENNRNEFDRKAREYTKKYAI
jgi:ubiquitin-conjugating enzyme E2 D/E